MNVFYTCTKSFRRSGGFLICCGCVVGILLVVGVWGVFVVLVISTWAGLGTGIIMGGVSGFSWMSDAPLVLFRW